jgi:hypothetical protein
VPISARASRPRVPRRGLGGCLIRAVDRLEQMGGDDGHGTVHKKSSLLAKTVLWMHHHVHGFEFLGLFGYGVEWILVRTVCAQLPTAARPHPRFT